MEEEIRPVSVDIVPGRHYPDEIWREALRTIGAATALVEEMRAQKREADSRYEDALSLRAAVQAPRDMMIATDGRTASQVSRHAGVGRARCVKIRDQVLARMDAASGASDASDAS